MNLVDQWDARLARGESTLVYNGEVLYREIYLSTQNVNELRIEFLNYTTEIPQILCVDLSPGRVFIGDVIGRTFNLWAVTAPSVAELGI